jgi:hypothetical protein
LKTSRKEKPSPAPAKGPTTEEIMSNDLKELQSGFAKRLKEETNRFLTTVDSEYWFCLCFDTREQKEAFLKATGWIDKGDKYLDGVEIAAGMGIQLPPTPAALKFVTEKSDKKLNEIAEEL